MLVTSTFIQQRMSGPCQHRNAKNEQVKGTGRKKQICHYLHVISSITLKAHKEFSDLSELISARQSRWLQNQYKNKTTAF